MRIGLVGAGPWASDTHAPALAAHRGVDFVGVWARRPEAVERFGAPVYPSYPALLDAVDAVAFAVPPAVQSAMATHAAQMGKHLILDKPIAANLAEAQELAEAVDAAGVGSVVMLTRRFAPETREFLADAAQHHWAAGAGMWLSGAALRGQYSASPWRHDQGALFDVGPHVLDLLDAALGKITKVVLASRDRPSDTWQLVLDHAGGARSTASLSLRTPMQPSVFQVAVHGTEGFRALRERDTSATDCYAVMLDEFLAAVDGGWHGHQFDVHRGLHLQLVIEDALDALDDELHLDRGVHGQLGDTNGGAGMGPGVTEDLAEEL